MSKTAEALPTTETNPLKKLEEMHGGARLTPTQNADSMHPNEAAFNEFLVDNPKLLAKAFDGFEAAGKGDKSFVEKYFSTKDYEARSPLLRKYAEKGHIPSDATLSERVRAITGQR